MAEEQAPDSETISMRDQSSSDRLNEIESRVQAATDPFPDHRAEPRTRQYWHGIAHRHIRKPLFVMSESKPSASVELVEFAAAIVISAVVATGGYLLLDLLPFRWTLGAIVLVALVAIAMVSAGLTRWEGRR